MAIPTIGKIVFTSISPTGLSVTLDTDPQIYKTSRPRRQIIHDGVFGSSTKQDWGQFAKDMTIRLESGPTQWLNASTVKTLLEWTAMKGSTWRFQDGEENDFTVSFESFEPDQAEGMQGLYVYTMDLKVWAIAKLIGDTYTGD